MARITDICHTLVANNYPRIHRLVGSILSYWPSGMLYCGIPKIGLTFWTRVFRFLNKDVAPHVRNPFEIDRMYVHFAPLWKMKVYNLSNKTDRDIINNKNGYTFMFARNPYSRLYSAYIDKFFLPDFWRGAGPIFAKRSGTSHRSHAKQSCPDDISFEEFADFVIDSILNRQQVNRHWAPEAWVCNPCSFPFDFIGNIETFSEDSKHILAHFGISDILPSNSSSYQMNEEVETLIIYNFDILRKLPKGCLTGKALAYRLWTTFQINGYILKESKFPSYIPKNVNVQSFKEIVSREMRANYLSKEESQTQRRAALAHAYAGLSTRTLNGLVKAYEIDFESFDYDTKPPR